MGNKVFLGTLTSKGQITLPAEARKALGLNPQDKVLFRLVDGKLELSPLPMTFEQLRGSVPALPTPMDDDELMRIAREDRLDEMIREGRI